MKQTISGLRELHGSCHVTELSDGKIVPWNPLPLKDYIKYKQDFERELIVQSVLENEIFCQCVIDTFLVKNINKQKAGTISSVVRDIMEVSAAKNINEFNYHLMAARQRITENVYHEMAILICAAFPAYTPDDIYNLKYDDLIIRLAQAERHLLKIGYLTEPLQLSNGEQEETQPQKQVPVALKEAFEQQELERQANQGVPKSKQRIKEDITPQGKDKFKNGKLIISKEELRVKSFQGADLEDAPFLEQKMLEDAASIYSNYMEDVKAGKEVIIKTPEERLQEKKLKDKTRTSKLKKK
jgi:hypothetical protein